MLSRGESMNRVREDLLMRAVVTRVSAADVRVDGKVVASLPRAGLLVLLGVRPSDGPVEANALAAKIWRLRILRGELSAEDMAAPILAVSQVTLYADTRKGRRPSMSAAAPGDHAEPVFGHFCSALQSLGATVERGVFGADMAVRSVNDGPVTLVLDQE